MNVAYLVLKTAHSLFGKNPATLETEELRRVERLAARQFDLESRVLASGEARDVVVPKASVDGALEEIRKRYQDGDSFQDDLAENGLSVEAYRNALERELKVEAVLEKVGSRAARVSDIDVELYYHYHPEQFQRPETRVARHILITVNEDIKENTRAAALERIEAISARLLKDPGRFEEQALKHSECPTAMNGGLLGEVRRDQLFPQLDAVLWELRPMQLSAVVESPLGLHILRCDRIIPDGKLPLHLVRDKVRELLLSRRKQLCQNSWLKQSQKQSRQQHASAEQSL